MTPPPRPEKSSKKTKVVKKKDKAVSAATGSEAGASSTGHDAKAKDISANATGDFEESDINEFSIDDLTSPQPVPPPSGKASRAVRSAVSTVDKPTASSKRLGSQKNASLDDAIEVSFSSHSWIAISHVFNLALDVA
jgi:hypothetical protein